MQHAAGLTTAERAKELTTADQSSNKFLRSLFALFLAPAPCGTLLKIIFLLKILLFLESFQREKVKNCQTEHLLSYRLTDTCCDVVIYKFCVAFKNLPQSFVLAINWTSSNSLDNLFNRYGLWGKGWPLSPLFRQILGGKLEVSQCKLKPLCDPLIDIHNT